MKSIFICLAALLVASSVFANEPTRTLKDFETDGCTMFVEGTISKPNLWGHCCFEHDLRYWFGGTSDNKDFSDLELRSCVKKVAGNFWANLIYRGVKSGSGSPIKHKYSWSWGWEPKRDNSELTSSEIQIVLEKIDQTEMDPEYREEFINKYIKN